MLSGFKAQLSSYLPSIKTFSAAVKRVMISGNIIVLHHDRCVLNGVLSFWIMIDSLAIFSKYRNANRTRI